MPCWPEIEQFLSAGASGPPAYPAAALVQGRDGALYGTTGYGGASGFGAVFRVSLAGTLTPLVSFNGANGRYPAAGLLLGSDGNFYSTTQCGGANGNHGTVFKLTPAGVLSTLVSFQGTNGRHPFAALVQGSDGNFYGTTTGGGAHGMGTVFELTPGGALTTLMSFNNSDGAAPQGALVEGSDSSFYGAACQGGAVALNLGAGFGTLFRLSPTGALTNLVVLNGSNGGNPASVLTRANDGNFYGTTQIGGNLGVNAKQGFGTVFKMAPSGSLTPLIVFTGASGSYPVGGLLSATDGNFYGATAGGGSGGGGTVFRMTPAGVLTTLLSFNGANGSGPCAALIQASDGNIYGTTKYGGAGGLGTVFQLSPAGLLKTLVAFGSQSNAALR